MAPDFSSLPDHIIEQILVKIPCIKSIVTCTSICKSWYASIKSPRFIDIHLSNPNNIDNKEYFLCSYVHRHGPYNQPFHSIQYNDSEELQTYYNLVFPHERCIMIIGSINGLICYTPKYYSTNGPRSIYMWNPAIRKLKILPKSRFYKKDAAYGFWFDANANDYKVAKMNYKLRCNVEVYSLSTNSWDLIATGGPDLGSYDTENVIHVINGTLHLLTCRYDRETWMIISFDINSGIFKETLIWQEETEKLWCVSLIMESHNRSLFVLQQAGISRDSLTCCVRVYDEGLNELYMIDLIESDIRSCLIGFRNINSNEVLFLEYLTGLKISICNIEDFGDIEAFRLKDFSFAESSIDQIFHIQPFAESLVLLND